MQLQEMFNLYAILFKVAKQEHTGPSMMGSIFPIRIHITRQYDRFCYRLYT
ncbi:hypothetical protein MKA39_22975 [[Clostridium] innocuum]|nr:hypothetical protein [[Clostridium] innocuum]